jgi:hypothetical protein
MALLISRRALAIAAALGSPVIGPPVAAGQQAVIVGVAHDTGGRPIPFAEAVLVGAKRKDRANDRGWFVLDSLEAGPDLLVVRAIGYKAQRVPISIAATDTLELEVVLAPQVQVLPDVVVTAYGRELHGIAAVAAQRLMRNGAPASGLITRDDLDTWAQHDLGNALRRAGAIVLADRAYCPNRNGQPVQMTVFLDGSPSTNDNFDVRSIPPDWIEAIEIYKSVATRPVEFNQTGTIGCVVVIWTRR